LRVASAVALALLLLGSSGCYWRYSNAQGDPFPTPVASETIPLRVGLALNGDSKSNVLASVAPSAVIQELAERLSEERVFAAVVYPMSSLARVQPDVVLDVTAHVEERQHYAENIAKAIFTGISLLLLGPVLPTHLTLAVDLSAAASAAGGAEIGTYRYRSEYDYYYTTMTPSGPKLYEWSTTARDHAVEDVLGQIQRDRHRFLAIAPQPAGG